jgi:biopolymer transport protein TolR
MAVTLDPLGGGRKRSVARFRPRAEINVTPFVDVMLVLLIVFMVAAPLLTVGELVELPQTTSDGLPSEDKPLAVMVRADGVVFIQETEVAREDLVPRLRAIAQAGGKTADDRIFLYGDDGAAYGEVLSVMALISDAGFPNLALVADPTATGRE